MIHPDDIQRINFEIEEYARKGVSEFSQQYRIFTRSGDLRWLDDHHWILRDEKGNATHYQAIVWDITDRKVAEEEIRKLNLELEQRVEARTAQLTSTLQELEAFSYSVSHDLRAPLRSINGFSQVLSEDYGPLLDTNGRNYLERIQRASQRMGLLIDALLQLSKVTRSEINRMEINLSQMAEEIVSDLDANHQRAIWVISPYMIAWADPILTRVVLVNLLGNACKFSSHRPDAHIEFGQIQQEGHTLFYVRDNGVGFDMANASKLFEAFHRLHKVSEFEGTGIGLALVHRIIQRHGGKIWAKAEENKGATFYFYFA